MVMYVDTISTVNRKGLQVLLNIEAYITLLLQSLKNILWHSQTQTCALSYSSNLGCGGECKRILCTIDY